MRLRQKRLMSFFPPHTLICATFDKPLNISMPQQSMDKMARPYLLKRSEDDLQCLNMSTQQPC